MVHEAHALAWTRGHHNTTFCQADSEALPFRYDVCDLITNKLAFHYFPHPEVALAEMVRVATHEARVVLIDRVSPEDPEQRAYQNRLEKLRTPSKTYVYSELQLVAALADVDSSSKRRPGMPNRWRYMNGFRPLESMHRRHTRFWRCSRRTETPRGYRCGAKAIGC